MLMPDVTIVASWRVMTVRSWALTRWKRERSISSDCFASEMSSGISPRWRSWSVTACLLSASTSPFACAPATSTALKTYVAILQLLRGRHRHVAAHQALELVRRRRPLLGERAGDLARAHEAGERGVHRL